MATYVLDLQIPLVILQNAALAHNFLAIRLNASEGKQLSLKQNRLLVGVYNDICVELPAPLHLN